MHGPFGPISVSCPSAVLNVQLHTRYFRAFLMFPCAAVSTICRHHMKGSTGNAESDECAPSALLKRLALCTCLYLLCLTCFSRHSNSLFILKIRSSEDPAYSTDMHGHTDWYMALLYQMYITTNNPATMQHKPLLICLKFCLPGPLHQALTVLCDVQLRQGTEWLVSSKPERRRRRSRSYGSLPCAPVLSVAGLVPTPLPLLLPGINTL